VIIPDEAWQLICQVLSPMVSQKAEINAALGYYLAEPVLADRDIPPADRAAMDGFAVRSADLATIPMGLRIVGEVAAGASADLPFGPGECARIFTGANVPSGADTVIRVEDTSFGSFDGQTSCGEVVVNVSAPVGSNIFRRGENAHQGQTLLRARTYLGANQIGVAAAVGSSTITVHAKPTVAVLTTGAELLAAEAAVAGIHETRDSNSHMLEAACRSEGFSVVLRRAVQDDLETIRRAVQQARQTAAVIILTGGVSAGKYDLVRPALDSLGATVHYHGVAVRPGRPQLFASLPDGIAVFGLPGNPLSAAVGLYEFVLPGLRLLAGCPADRCRPLLHLPLSTSAGKKCVPAQIIPAVLNAGPAGTRISPRPPVGSADLVTAGVVDGAILVPSESGPLLAGTIAVFRPWGGLCR